MDPGERDGAVTLQVNVAPSDAPHALATLSHQLRLWGGQVAEVLYSFDLKRSAGPRGQDFDRLRPRMEAVLAGLAQPAATTSTPTSAPGPAPARGGGSPPVRVMPVDYGAPARARVAEMFFAGRQPPDKDCFGAPFYGYFHGLASVRTRYVLHMDCDMLFGGGSGHWLADALTLLGERPEVLFVCPLAGPPTPDGSIPRAVRRMQRDTQLFGSRSVLEARDPLTYRFRHVSTRVFCTDLERLRAVGPLAVLDAPHWTYGSDLADTPFLPAETVLSRQLHQRGRVRLDYLGSDPGMWFLHPGQRGEAFLANLPGVIAAIEAGRVPDAQRGRYELCDETLAAAGPLPVARARRPTTLRSAARRVARRSGVPQLRRRLRAQRYERRLRTGDRPAGRHRAS